MKNNEFRCLKNDRNSHFSALEIQSEAVSQALPSFCPDTFSPLRIFLPPVASQAHTYFCHIFCFHNVRQKSRRDVLCFGVVTSIKLFKLLSSNFKRLSGEFEPTQRQKLEMTDSKIYRQFSLRITYLSASDSLFQLWFLSFFSFVLRQHLTLWEADEPQEVQQLDRGEHQHHDAHRLQPLRLPDRVQHCSTLGPLLATIPRPEPGAWAGLLALGAARTSAPSRPCTPVPLHQLQRYTGPHARAGRFLAPAYCPLAPQIQSG